MQESGRDDGTPSRVGHSGGTPLPLLGTGERRESGGSGGPALPNARRRAGKPALRLAATERRDYRGIRAFWGCVSLVKNGTGTGWEQ